MKKKLFLSLAGAASLALVLNTAAPVMAAETNPAASAQDQSQQTNASTSNNTKGESTTDTTKQDKTADNQTQPATGKNEANKESKKPVDNGKAVSYMNRYVKLKRNAYIYDKNGKKTKHAKLKKGTIVRITGFTNVKGKSLLNFNGKKNQYIKPGNVKTFRAASYKVKRNAKIYNSKGKLKKFGNKYTYIQKGKTVPVIKAKKINGKKFVGISDTQFVKWSDLNHKTGKAINK